MRRLKQKIERINTQIYNPVGLNILWPRNVAFLFVRIFFHYPRVLVLIITLRRSVAWQQQLEIEYYVRSLCAVGAFSYPQKLTILVLQWPFWAILILDTFQRRTLLIVHHLAYVIGYIDNLICWNGDCQLANRKLQCYRSDVLSGLSQAQVLICWFRTWTSLDKWVGGRTYISPCGCLGMAITSEGLEYNICCFNAVLYNTLLKLPRRLEHDRDRLISFSVRELINAWGRGGLEGLGSSLISSRSVGVRSETGSLGVWNEVPHMEHAMRKDARPLWAWCGSHGEAQWLVDNRRRSHPFLRVLILNVLCEWLLFTNLNDSLTWQRSSIVE
jgi:hypothetical protein